MSRPNSNTKPEDKPKLGRGVGPDGIPRLPPIPTSALRREDPYAKSKLLKYRAAKDKQQLLTKIMLDNAVKAYEDTVDQNQRDEQRKSTDEPSYPDQVSTTD